MLTIRLFRTGKKNQPSFKIVVTEKQKSSTRGRFVEEVGIYNPLTKQRNVKGDRVKYWISVGAQPSATVHNILVSDNIIEGAKIAKHKKSKKEQPAAETPEVAPAEAPAEEAASAPDAPTAEPEKQDEAVPEAPVEEAKAKEKPA